MGKAKRKMEMALKQMKEARETLADIAYWGKGEEKVIPIMRALNEAMRDLSNLIGETSTDE